MCGNLISHPMEQSAKLLFVGKSSSIELVRRMKIPILKNCLVICERFKSRILYFELNAVEKYNVLERVFEAVRDESSLRKQPSFFAPGPSPLGLGAKKDGCYRRLRRKLLSPRRRLVQKKKKTKTKERCRDENRKLCIYSYRYANKLEESKAYVLVINGHSLHTT